MGGNTSKTLNIITLDLIHLQVTHKESKSVMAYQLPTEIQYMIWTYSMYNSAKELEFRKLIQEGWFKLGLRRLSNALETKS